MKQIPGRNAPAIFSPDLWAQLLELTGSADAAWTGVSTGYLWPFSQGWDRTNFRDRKTLDDVNWTDEERTELVGYLIRKELQAALADGEIIGWGRRPPALELEQIPPSLWSKMDFNLGSNYARNADYRFIDLHFSAERPSEARLVAWMRQQPNSLRKELKARSEAIFPGLTTAAFNAAYSKAFNKVRGRPPKSSPR